MIAKLKAQLRAELCSRRREPFVYEMQMICSHIINSSVYQAARVIGGYMPTWWEADITPVMLDALQSGKTVALPLCGANGTITMRCIRTLEELRRGAFGILEPASDAPLVPGEDIDFLLVPLEGIDRRGNRLGKGGGYYDRLLPNVRGVSIGCACSWQWVETVPAGPGDVPLRACVDMNGIHVFNKFQKGCYL